LKGSSGNIGATRLFDVCRQLDEQGKAGDLSQMPALVASLEAEYARVEAAIKQLIA
jgi:HPt (histidine-containing phosphotransfer) domain-containing protein